MRILAPRKRKVLARLTMFEKKDKQGNMDYISSFGIDDKNRVAWFSYLMDTNIHIYSFGQRKNILIHKVYSHDPVLYGKFNFRFKSVNLTLLENKPDLNFILLQEFGLCLIHHKVELQYGDTEDSFKLCRFDPLTCKIETLASKILKSKSLMFSQYLTDFRHWNGCRTNDERR